MRKERVYLERESLRLSGQHVSTNPNPPREKPIADTVNGRSKAPTVVEDIFLTADEVVERYRGMISVGTLRNWRVAKTGPAFVKVGRSVLYPLSELQSWDRRNLVPCRNRLAEEEQV